MEKIFLVFLNRSLAAGVMIAAIVLIRLILKGMPRKYFVVLWGLAALRLMLPFSLESAFSLVPARSAVFPQIVSAIQTGWMPEAGGKELADVGHGGAADAATGLDGEAYAGYGGAADAAAGLGGEAYAGHGGAWDAATGLDGEAYAGYGSAADAAAGHNGGEAYAGYGGAADTAAGYSGSEMVAASGSMTNIVTHNFLQTAVHVASIVWAAGCAAMLAWACAGWAVLRRKASVFTEEDGVRECDYIDTPFVFGLIRPVIYLPSSLSAADRAFVIAHEAAHIRRHDQIWKLAGYILLAVYWFNPLVWLAFLLFCRDIEFACDESVLDGLNGKEKRGYAAALLNCSIPHGMVAATPLALADISVKKRVRHAIEYRRAAARTGVLCVICCVFLSACFLTDPVNKEPAQARDDVSESQSAADRTTAESVPDSSEPMAEEENAAEKDPVLGPWLQTVGTEQNAAIAQEAGLYVRQIVDLFDARNSGHYEANAFSTINGYIAARHMEVLREYCRLRFEPGVLIKDVSIRYDKPEGYEKEKYCVADLGDGTFLVNVKEDVSYRLGDSIEAYDVFSYDVTVKKEGEAYRCIDLAERFQTRRTYETFSSLYDQMKEEGVLEKTLPEQADYVDDVFQRYFESFASSGIGDVSSVAIDEESFVSERFTDEDFQNACGAIRVSFALRDAYCRLDSLYYVGDEETDAQRMGNSSWSGFHADDFMVIGGSFTTGERGKVSPAVEPEFTYDPWFWFLRRSEGGGWVVWDEGV